MRPLFLFIVGLIFMGATLLEVGIIFLRIVPPRVSNTASLPEDILQPPRPQPIGLTLILAKTAIPSIYEQVGQLITYTYVITNNGSTPLGPTQFTIIDNQFDEPLECGPASITLAPSQPLTCTASYIITQADMSTASVTNIARASGAGETSASVAVAILNLSFFATPPATPPTETVVAITPTVSTIAPMRITFDAGETTSSRTGIINPNDRTQFVVAATQGQVLTINLTAPYNEVWLGVNDPTGLVLKSLDTTYTWSTTIMTGGDYFINIVRANGGISIPYSLQVTLTSVPVSSTLEPSPAPTLVVEAEWPKRLEVGQSDTIRISLIRVSDNTYIPTVEIAGHTSVASTAISIGTPGVNPAAAMGPDYESVATVYLAAPAFEVSPGSSLTQSLDQSRIDWTWSVVSEQANSQVINATIEIEWKRRDGVGSPIQRTIWRSSPPLDIEVFQPLITTGQLSISALVSALVGSGLSIPFLYGIITTRKGKTQVKQKGKSQRG